jgi:pimeloyl-ACP methyl ester carboxylesterase
VIGVQTGYCEDRRWRRSCKPRSIWIHLTTAEIQAWAECKPLVDRAYVRAGMYLGDDAWEELFDALRVPTLLLVPLDSLVAPRQPALHNDLARTVVVPGDGHCVRRDQPARYLRAVDAFLAEVARHSRPGARRMRLFHRLADSLARMANGTR